MKFVSSRIIGYGNLNNATMKSLRTLFFLLTCIFLSVISNIALGQQVIKHEIGLEGGAGISFLRELDRDNEYNYPALCYTFGISYQYSISESFSFFTALDYERKGYTVKIPTFDQMGDLVEEVAHSYYSYMVLPLLVRFSFGNQIKLFCNVGPYVGYLMKVAEINEENDSNGYISFFGTDHSYKYDFGISAGLGAKIPINSVMAFKFEVRNNLGLVNTINATIGDDEAVIKINSTNLLLGVTFIL